MNNTYIELTKTIKKYDKVILMGHHDPDLDAIGSILGLYEIISKFKIVPYLFLDIKDNNYNESIKEVIKLTQNDYKYVYTNNYQELIDNKTLVIISDVHQTSRIEYPDILNSNIDIMVLDHHIKSHDYIKNTVLFYIDSNLSSMVEFVGYYAKYLGIQLSSLCSTIMLCGLEIDTNVYNLKTTEKTYEIAGYFTSMGVDSILKQNLLKESKASYLRKADFIRKSYAIENKIAICVLNNDILKTNELAEISDELLKLVDIEASFTIGKLAENKIGISARSIGDIDVCKIMEYFNGGGHKNNAATQIENKSLKEVEKELKKKLEEYI